MNKKVWLFYFSIFLVLIAVTFSPLVIPSGVATPWVLGMPRTLWAGILISVLLAVLTLFAAQSIKDEE